MGENLKEKKLEILSQELESLAEYAQGLWRFLPMAICHISPQGFILDVNPSFESFSLWPISEISGKSLNLIFDLKETSKIIGQTLKKGFIENYETDLLTKKKNKIAVAVYSRVRRDEKGDVIGLFLAVVDIRESKKFREELEERVKKRTQELENSRKALMNMLEDVEGARAKAEEEKNKTEAIILNFSDGLLIFNEESKLFSVNSQAENYLKIKSKEIIGKSVSELAENPEFASLIDIFGEKIKGIFRKEIQTKENFILEISTIPIIKEEEKMGTLVILHDVTREKMIERIKSEFVSLAAHQLRTPLSAIKWTLRMLLDGDLGEITKEQREFIEKTYQSNERMIGLINDLLDVTRIEEGRYLYKPIFTDFETIIQFVINYYQEEIKRKNFRFEFRKPKQKLPRIKVDIEKIRLAVDNILNNAIRYTPSGGEITISLRLGKKELEFSIKDSGVGIPKDQQERVFTKFFRAANVMRLETEGSGLGLFITKNIIEAHGGRIWFESEEGKGATFYFTIPAREEFERFVEGF